MIPSETAQNLLFQLPKRHELDGPFEDLNRYSNGKVLFFASDVGGSENLMEFYLRIEKEKSLIVEGGGCEVFDYFGIPYTNSTEMDYSDYNSFIFSTGSDNMRLSKIRNSFSDQSFNHLCILDNWVNFSHRFSRSEMTIPKKVAVTNEVAFQIAKQQLPDSEVILVHDFRLERLRDIRTVNQFRDPNRILVVLEPERPEIEGLGQITKGEQLLAIKRAVNLAQHMGIDEIVIRVHPKMVANFSITDQYESNQKVTLSKNPRIEDDLSTTVAVVGLSSAVLYASASLGIPTYSVIPFDRNSWIGKFGNINYLGEGSP
jgi:hypothetical protein